MNFKPTEVKTATKKPTEVKVNVLSGCDHEKTEKKKEDTLEEKLAHTQANDQWYVCYQDAEQNMTWSNFNFEDENKARESYKSHKGKKARMLFHYEVVEKDGDEVLIKEMKEYADKYKLNKELNDIIKEAILE